MIFNQLLAIHSVLIIVFSRHGNRMFVFLSKSTMRTKRLQNGRYFTVLDQSNCRYFTVLDQSNCRYFLC